MHCLEAVSVDDSFVDELWIRVSGIGGYYSIGDGITKDVFRRMLFSSAMVLQAPNLTIRLADEEKCLEVHPIAFGPSAFRHAACAMDDIVELRDKVFKEKPICCIIPDGMRGAKRLALAAGMTKSEAMVRDLSGVQVSCTVFRR